MYFFSVFLAKSVSSAQAFQVYLRDQLLRMLVQYSLELLLKLPMTKKLLITKEEEAVVEELLRKVSC